MLPEWLVFYEDFNRKCICEYNVFRHHAFFEACKKALKKYGKDGDRDALEDEIRGSAMYFFWSKCEWEVIITGWPPPKEDSGFIEQKVDVYRQLRMNWEPFIDYVIAHKKDFLRRKKD